MTNPRSLQTGAAGRIVLFAAAALILLVLALTCREPEAKPGIAMNGINWQALSRGGPAALSGTAPSGTRISLSADGEPIAEILPESNGRWSYSGQLPQGAKSVIATAQDAQGRILGSAVLSREPLAETAIRSEGAEAARPEPEEAEAPVLESAAAPVVASPRPGEVLAPGVHEISGRGAPGMPLEVLADGESLAQTTVAADGAWQAQIELQRSPRVLAVRKTLGEAHPQAEVALALPSPMPDSVAAAPAEERPGSYTVQAGDTLSGISARFNIKMSRLCQLNRLRSPDRILAGQVLRLRRP